MKTIDLSWHSHRGIHTFLCFWFIDNLIVLSVQQMPRNGKLNYKLLRVITVDWRTLSRSPPLMWRNGNDSCRHWKKKITKCDTKSDFHSKIDFLIIDLFFNQMIELEASNGNPDATAELHQEICHLRSRAEHLDSELRQKDKEIDQMRKRMEDQCQVYSTSHKVDDKLKVCLF